MILWGMIGILQCLFLPGIVALRGLRAFRPGLAPHTSGAGEVFLAVLLSLALNHWLVVVLVALEIYSTELTRALFLGEFVVLAALALREQYTTGSSSKLRPKSRPWTEFVRNGPIAASLCLALFAYFANAFVDWVATWDSAFTTWDAVVSWNHWATVWASGQRPSHLWEYPQLIPILISIVYRVAGDTEIQLFAKAMITGLPLLGTVCYFYVSRVRREANVAGIVGAIFFLGMNQVFLFPDSGYADAPLASVIAIFLGLFLCVQPDRSRPRDSTILFLSMIGVGVAALGKQTGILAFLSLPFLFRTELRGTTYRSMLMWVGVAAAVALPWYAIRAVHMFGSVDESFGNRISGISQTIPFPLLERPANAIRLVLGRFSDFSVFFSVISGVGALLVLPAFEKKNLGRTFALFALAVGVVWAFTSSYDTRNLAVAVPFLAWTIGFGAQTFYDRFRASLPTNAVIPYSSPSASFWIILLSVALGAAAIGDRLISNNELREANLLSLRGMGQAGVNIALYRYLPPTDPAPTIRSEYQILKFLPGIKSNYVRESCYSETEAEDAVARWRTSDYVLLVPSCAEKYRQNLADRGRRIFDRDGYSLYEIIR